MIYAPRSEADLEVVVEILKAAAWWVGGVCLDDDEMDLTTEARVVAVG